MFLVSYSTGGAGDTHAVRCHARFDETHLTSSLFQPALTSTCGDGSHWPGIFTGAPLNHAFRDPEPSMRSLTLPSAPE